MVSVNFSDEYFPLLNTNTTSWCSKWKKYPKEHSNVEDVITKRSNRILKTRARTYKLCLFKRGI